MVLITGYKEIKSRAFYHLSFEIGDRKFYHIKGGIENPEEALELVHTLEGKGILPEIERTICYDSDNGRIVKEPENEIITIERLTEIVENNEPTQTASIPVVSYGSPRSVDIGD